ncbi:hypothetical protein AB0M22_39510 [Nocardia sp. NPDC051756]|uniref:hypothetical protein n=1 Tax=Nocardia sp. NPDC051756 TaxID=3154751 RepID=UPI003431FD4F
MHLDRTRLGSAVVVVGLATTTLAVAVPVAHAAPVCGSAVADYVGTDSLDTAFTLTKLTNRNDEAIDGYSITFTPTHLKGRMAQTVTTPAGQQYSDDGPIEIRIGTSGPGVATLGYQTHFHPSGRYAAFPSCASGTRVTTLSGSIELKYQTNFKFVATRS